MTFSNCYWANRRHLELNRQKQKPSMWLLPLRSFPSDGGWAHRTPRTATTQLLRLPRLLGLSFQFTNITLNTMTFLKMQWNSERNTTSLKTCACSFPVLWKRSPSLLWALVWLSKPRTHVDTQEAKPTFGCSHASVTDKSHGAAP